MKEGRIIFRVRRNKFTFTNMELEMMAGRGKCFQIFDNGQIDRPPLGLMGESFKKPSAS